jgi:heme exporter protein A
MRLEAIGLSCIRGGRQVFADISFSVAGGETLLVTGRNGAGKSSLLRILGGLVRLAGGRLNLADTGSDRTIPEQAHYLGHQDALKSSLTVGENLSFWTRYLGGTGSPGAALAAWELDRLADLPAAYLSAGQRRRLSLARLVAVRRPIWLLDEPTSALDRDGQERLAKHMREHLAGGGLIVAATHGPIALDRAKELRLGEQE